MLTKDKDFTFRMELQTKKKMAFKEAMVYFYDLPLNSNILTFYALLFEDNSPWFWIQTALTRGETLTFIDTLFDHKTEEIKTYLDKCSEKLKQSNKKTAKLNSRGNPQKEKELYESYPTFSTVGITGPENILEVLESFYIKIVEMADKEPEYMI